MTATPSTPSPSAPEPPPHKGRKKRRLSLTRIGLLFLIVYGVFNAVLFFVQAWLIFPGRDTQGRGRVEPAPGREIVRLTTASGDRVAAVFGPALTASGQPRPDASRGPTVLLFYGNGSWLNGSLSTFAQFRKQGFNVMMPEYVGFGMSSGQASEGGCYATADAAYHHLAARSDVDPSKIIAAGYSLGGAVAIDLASRRTVAGVAAFNTFTSLTELASRQFPYVPVPLLLQHRFESERKVPRLHCPLFLACGTADTLVPSTMTDRLARAARVPVTCVRVPGADHNDLLSTGEDQVFPALRKFAAKLSPSRSAPAESTRGKRRPVRVSAGEWEAGTAEKGG